MAQQLLATAEQSDGFVQAFPAASGVGSVVNDDGVRVSGEVRPDGSVPSILSMFDFP
jgi:hypothetical protein